MADRSSFKDVLLQMKITRAQEKEIEAYCKRHNIINRSEFFRYAITQIIRPDVEDPELVFSSLKQLHDKLNTVERQQEILFSFIGYLSRYFLSYHAEIPAELRKAAATSAMERYDKLFKSYQESLKNTPSMFESLLADFIEEH